MTMLKNRLLALAAFLLVALSLFVSPIIAQLGGPDDTEALLGTMTIKEGDWVADVGSGEGEYTLPMTKAVGDSGRAFAVDIDEDDLEELNAEIKDRGIENIATISGVYDNPMLPRRSFDALLVRNAYHEFTAHKQMLDHLRAALRHRFDQAFQRGVEMRDLHEAEAIADRFRQFLDASGDPDSTVESETSSSSTPPSAEAAEVSDEPAHLERLTIDLPGKVRVIPVEEIRYITAFDTSRPKTRTSRSTRPTMPTCCASGCTSWKTDSIRRPSPAFTDLRSSNSASSRPSTIAPVETTRSGLKRAKSST
jgi:SAM-dependent methyltransferase